MGDLFAKHPFMTETFFAVTNEIDYDAVQLTEMTGFEDNFLLGSGTAVGAEYPKNVGFKVEGRAQARPGPSRSGASGKMKAGANLPDSLRNQDSVLVVSDRLSAILSAAEKKLELLPVKISSKPPAAYFIVNALEHIDCLDHAKSDTTWGDGLKQPKMKDGKVADRIWEVKKGAHLDPHEVPAGRRFFQVARLEGVWFARKALADELIASGVTGLRVRPAAEYRAH